MSKRSDDVILFKVNRIYQGSDGGTVGGTEGRDDDLLVVYNRQIGCIQMPFIEQQFTCRFLLYIAMRRKTHYVTLNYCIILTS